MPIGNIQVMRMEPKRVQLFPDMTQQTNNTIIDHIDALILDIVAS